MTANENQIVVYQPNETVRLDVRLENETVWLTQEQIANLFGTKRPAITKHLANIYKSGELEREGTCSILEHMGNDGNRSCQNRFWDAKSLLIKFIRRAKKELIVIDAYPGVATLDMLAKRGRGVKIELADLRSQNVTSKVDVKEAA